MEDIENEWGEKYVNDQNKMFDDQEQMQHYFLDHIE